MTETKQVLYKLSTPKVTRNLSNMIPWSQCQMPRRGRLRQAWQSHRGRQHLGDPREQIIAVSVEYPRRKPDWDDGSRQLASRSTACHRGRSSGRYSIIYTADLASIVAEYGVSLRSASFVTSVVTSPTTASECFRTLVVSLAHSRLDSGNFVLVGLVAYLQGHLQSVVNAAARLVFRLRRYDHVTDALATLHWLRLPQRVDFKGPTSQADALPGAPTS